MHSTDEIVKYLDERLAIGELSDASMNGLQVQGATKCERIAVATDAALETYRGAVEQGCQMVFAHHGLIWGGLKYIRDRNYDHLKYLFDNNLNLYAAHLPLDAHPELGNNAQLADVMALESRGPFGRYHGVPLGFAGSLPAPTKRKELAAKLGAALGCDPRILDFGPEEISTVGVVSGRGGVLTEAIDQKLDLLVTGEGSHENYHEAREGRTNVFYLGHYHSETLGVKAVARDLERRFGVETVFIEHPTGF